MGFTRLLGKTDCNKETKSRDSILHDTLQLVWLRFFSVNVHKRKANTECKCNTIKPAAHHNQNNFDGAYILSLHNIFTFVVVLIMKHWKCVMKRGNPLAQSSFLFIGGFGDFTYYNIFIYHEVADRLNCEMFEETNDTTIMFPKFFVCGHVLVSKNNHVSSYLWLPKY
jgi:hypothetical protein